MKQLFYTIARYFYLIIVIGSLFVYGFNKDDHKDDSIQCIGSLGIGYYSHLNYYLMYWKDKGLCCQYVLNEDNNIIQKCQ